MRDWRLFRLISNLQSLISVQRYGEMQFLHTAIDFFRGAALLIPIGALGLFRWMMWLAKRIPALFYRPIQNDYDTTATIVTPVYSEDPVLFRRAIESWLVNKPDKIIAVIDVTDTTCM